jgi:hypothetical protein
MLASPDVAGLAVGLESGVEQFELGITGLQSAVFAFQLQDLSDAGQVDAQADEFSDPFEARQIVSAVAAGISKVAESRWRRRGFGARSHGHWCLMTASRSCPTQPPFAMSRNIRTRLAGFRRILPTS